MVYLSLHRFKENTPILLTFNTEPEAILLGQYLQKEGEIDYYSLYEEMTTFEAKSIIRDFWGDRP